MSHFLSGDSAKFFQNIIVTVGLASIVINEYGSLVHLIVHF